MLKNILFVFKLIKIDMYLTEQCSPSQGNVMDYIVQ